MRVVRGVTVVPLPVVALGTVTRSLGRHVSLAGYVLAVTGIRRDAPAGEIGELVVADRLFGPALTRYRLASRTIINDECLDAPWDSLEWLCRLALQRVGEVRRELVSFGPVGTVGKS